MNKSTLFTQAHKMTKAIIKAGDNYQATFGLCLSYLYKQAAKPKRILVLPVADETIKSIKADLKAQGFRVSIRRHKQQYANGGIQINPWGKGKMRFDDAELLALVESMVKHGLDTRTWETTKVSTFAGNIEKLRLFYGSHISFVNEYKVAA